MEYLKHIFELHSVNESQISFSKKRDELRDHLNAKPFDAHEVEQFILKFDPQELEKFEKYFIDHGVLSLQNLKVLKTFFRHLINKELLDKIKKTTEKTFQQIEELLELSKSGSFKSNTNTQDFKKALANKDEILRRLEQMERRISRFQENL